MGKSRILLFFGRDTDDSKNLPYTCRKVKILYDKVA